MDPIPNLWIGCDRDTKTLKSFAQLRVENSPYLSVADDTYACRQAVNLPPVSVQDQIESQRKDAEEMVSALTDSVVRAQARYVENGKFCGKKGAAFIIELQVKATKSTWKKIKANEILAFDLNSGSDHLIDLDDCSSPDQSS